VSALTTITVHIGSVEEMLPAMANAYALGGFSGSALMPDVERFMATQPPGYRDHASFRIHGGRLKQGMPSLIADAISAGGGIPTLPMPLGPLLFDRAGQVVRADDVPVYLIRDPARSSAQTFNLITSIPSLRRTERFSKDLARLPEEIRKKWAKAQQLLANTARSRSLNLEKLKNCDTVFSIRIDRGIRATIRQYRTANGRRYGSGPMTTSTPRRLASRHR
jgi:hypothetical protein